MDNYTFKPKPQRFIAIFRISLDSIFILFAVEFKGNKKADRILLEGESRKAWDIIFSS